ncbi:hypothetical protein F5B21DRAFT_387262 [Xylaria acuta]|nr:hypothetical protein F5B21DRAFT_387262 [Xylaria acuta]
MHLGKLAFAAHAAVETAAVRRALVSFKRGLPRCRCRRSGFGRDHDATVGRRIGVLSCMALPSSINPHSKRDAGEGRVGVRRPLCTPSSPRGLLGFISICGSSGNVTALRDPTRISMSLQYPETNKCLGNQATRNVLFLRDWRLCNWSGSSMANRSKECTIRQRKRKKERRMNDVAGFAQLQPQTTVPLSP